jgi:hypothetical protein
MHAYKKVYQSLIQLKDGFFKPISDQLDLKNLSVRMSNQNTLDGIVNIYLNQFNNHKTGASTLNTKDLLGAVMLKHMINLSYEETIQMIQENLYIQ